MKRKEITRRCKCPCNKELPSRYKGRLKEFFDGRECRKVWQKMTQTEKDLRKEEMESDIQKEIEIRNIKRKN